MKLITGYLIFVEMKVRHPSFQAAKLILFSVISICTLYLHVKATELYNFYCEIVTISK